MQLLGWATVLAVSRLRNTAETSGWGFETLENAEMNTVSTWPHQDLRFSRKGLLTEIGPAMAY